MIDGPTVIGARGHDEFPPALAKQLALLHDSVTGKQSILVSKALRAKPRPGGNRKPAIQVLIPCLIPAAISGQRRDGPSQTLRNCQENFRKS
jgi:hypothetical protein